MHRQYMATLLGKIVIEHGMEYDGMGCAIFRHTHMRYMGIPECDKNVFILLF